MDETLLRRGQALGGALICIAYFLPWASIISPLGSVEIRGLYVDYAWALLLLGIAHLLIQFARINYAALAIPDATLRHLDTAWSLIPFIFIAFFAWYGGSFLFHGSTGGQVNLFGISVDTTVRSGLDYGFWIGAIGAVLLALAVGFASERARPLATYGAGVALAAILVAFGLSKIGSNQATTNALSSLTAAIAPLTPTPTPTATPTEPVFDFSPYVRMGDISGSQLPKDYEAHRFSDTVVISVAFRNVGNKTITGVQGRISMLDGFGKEVYGFAFRADDKIPPGEEKRGGYTFEGNQFMEDDPYHKMLPLINGGTAKYSYKISHIAFEDGTVLPK